MAAPLAQNIADAIAQAHRCHASSVGCRIFRSPYLHYTALLWLQTSNFWQAEIVVYRIAADDGLGA